MKKNILKWLAPIFACAGQMLIIFGNPLAFVCWTVGEGILLYHDYKRKEASEIIFMLIYVITNIVALINWTFNIV